MARIAIAGAGVLGRLLAWRLARAGHELQVFDPAPGPAAPPTGRGPAEIAAGFTAAGMLSPLAELDNAGPELAALGWRSLMLWHEVARQLKPEGNGYVRRNGSLMVAHGSDLGAAQRVLDRLQAALAEAPDWPHPRALSRAELQALEPALQPDLKAWLLPEEGQLLPRELLQALAEQAPGVQWCWGRKVAQVQPGRMVLDDGAVVEADLAIDVRGLGARGDGEGPALGQGAAGAARALDAAQADRLRGVRGELVWLHAPGVELQRPVRLLHPRHRVYIVPRPGDLVVVGASEIESEDRSPVSLRSAVELMAAAHSVLPELAEARIVHLDANLRPAWNDHLPRIENKPGLLRITGLFRHGWLLAPALVEDGLAACRDIEPAEVVHG